MISRRRWLSAALAVAGQRALAAQAAAQRAPTSGAAAVDRRADLDARPGAADHERRAARRGSRRPGG